MKQQSEQFRAQGYRVRFTVEAGQPHRLETLAGVGAARLLINSRRPAGVAIRPNSTFRILAGWEF
jgi:hypothetical protein